MAAALTATIGAAILKPWSASSGEPEIATASIASDPSAGTQPGDARDRLRRAASSDSSAIRAALRPARIAEWPDLVADPDHLDGQPIVTDRDLGGTKGDGTCGGSARVTPFDELIAVAVPPGERIAAVRMFAIDSIRRPDVRIRLPADRPGPLDGRTLGGLTLIGLPSGGIAARQYALIADTTSAAGPGRLIYTICVS